MKTDMGVVDVARSRLAAPERHHRCRRAGPVHHMPVTMIGHEIADLAGSKIHFGVIPLHNVTGQFAIHRKVRAAKIDVGVNKEFQILAFQPAINKRIRGNEAAGRTAIGIQQPDAGTERMQIQRIRRSLRDIGSAAACAEKEFARRAVQRNRHHGQTIG